MRHQGENAVKPALMQNEGGKIRIERCPRCGIQLPAPLTYLSTGVVEAGGLQVPLPESGRKQQSHSVARRHRGQLRLRAAPMRLGAKMKYIKGAKREREGEK
uniref:Uncharacterized protein n=1 Tax=Sphaerodactylus townsendi TaxID=933632 RepID=A0ACB8FZF8_9SAUR